MALLFDRDRSVISRHINNIYKEGELDKNTSVHYLHISPNEKNPSYRPPEYYNLDVVISVGYRVKSKNGIIFRKWANSVLKKYLLKGYVISESRTLVTNENYINLINEVNNLKNDVNQIKDVLSSKAPNSFISYEGKVFESFIFVNSLICSAKERVIIVDGYADNSALDFFC